MPITNKELALYTNNSIFIETGYGAGKGVKAALDAGFTEIYSIEYVKDRCDAGRKQYEGMTGINIIHGDSAVELPKLLESIAEPVTFWLDAHYDNAKAKECEHLCPILHELEIIAAHPIKNHTILIDDIRLFRDKQHWQIHLDEIVKLIPKINAKYSIKYVGGRFENDILVAEVTI